MEIKNENFYNPFESMTFTYDKCFLCGKDLKNSKSSEHVFPKWLQHEFDLWDKEIKLLNDTYIPYQKLTIPCCKECNNEDLAELEAEIKTAFKKGYSGFLEIENIKIFQWISKIYYGLIFKELSLLIDRQNPSKGEIMTPELLKKYEDLHAFLQSIKNPINFQGFKPWSIFIVETIKYEDERKFDYFDGLETFTFAIRMGSIGVIANLLDNGAQKQIGKEFYKDLKGVKLHSIQFDELVAKVVYYSTLMNRVPKYISFLPKEKKEETLIISLPLQGYTKTPIFDPWVTKDYAKILSVFWKKYGLKLEDIFIEPNKVMSMIKNKV